MKRVLKGISIGLTVIGLTFMLCLWILPYTMPRWLPHLLPASWQAQVGPVSWQYDGLYIEDLSLSSTTAACPFLISGPITLSLSQWKPTFKVDSLQIDSACLPAQEETTASEPLNLPDLLKKLPDFALQVDELTLLPWREYSGQLTLDNENNLTVLSYQGENVCVTAHWTPTKLEIQQLEIQLPGQEYVLNTLGKVAIPLTMQNWPRNATWQGELRSPNLVTPLQFHLTWNGTQGNIQVTEIGDSQPLLDLPWRWQDRQLSVQGGLWRWPHGPTALSGGIALQLSEWQRKEHEATLSARLNILTQGAAGKANVVFTLGPGKVGLENIQLPFQVTGKANLHALSFYASLPGTLQGGLEQMKLSLTSGALLRMQGPVSPDITFDEARFPLAGITITRDGISGRLQAISQVSDKQWGKFKLHMDGQARAFWPDKGEWVWNYWGKGQLPLLQAKWDMSGHGQWRDQEILLDRLSTGFNQLHYGMVTLQAPRLILKSPLLWQRSEGKPTLGGEFELTAQQTLFKGAGTLPPSRFNLKLTGEDPAHFQFKGQLAAGKIGPVQLAGRWDGERLRGQSWWPEQSLMVFQPLLPPNLQWKIRGGSHYAQMAFSAAAQQGFEMGGHWVVKNGSLWLQDGELSGLDFVLSLRLKDHRWQFGPQQPVTLRVSHLNNLFNIRKITANLQGSYPYDAQHPLVLSQVGMDLLQGEVRMPELRLPQNEPARLSVERIDLSELLTVLQQKQFALSGQINGELPLYINDPHWLIKEGWLSNRNQLTLRLDPETAEAISNNNIAARSAIDWLRYLEISRSKATVNLDTQGLLTLQSHIVGYNTARSKTQPVSLNYRHEENLFQLWRSLRFADNLQEWLEESVTLPKGGKNE